ncbi:hypothetical protein PS15m_002244 [Mucor circinelloides]
MLYQAVDYLPRTWEQAKINTATAMVLPLQAAFYVSPNSSFIVPVKAKEMMVSDVFQYDARLNFVHWKDTNDPSLLQWKRAPSTVFRGLASGKLKFQPYFVPVCSPSPPVDADVSFAPLVNQFRLQDGLGQNISAGRNCVDKTTPSLEEYLCCPLEVFLVFSSDLHPTKKCSLPLHNGLHSAS